MTLDDLLAPITPATFFAEYFDRKPLHVPGGVAKFAQVLSWRQINRLLDMTHIWSEQSLKMVLDGATVPAAQYSTRATSRDQQPVLQPDPARMREWIKRGASVVLNDVDSLTPGLASVSEALEGAGLGKSQANTYISWQAHKAFASHYDTHDVWAVQVEGEKTWYIWEGRAEWPISHPAFRGQPQAHHDAAKGKLLATIVLKPGDLLYLPRGWYHDAMTLSEASVHIAYGVHAPLGMDFLNILVERVLYDAEFRKPLPRQDGSAAAKFALTSRAALLGQRLGELSRDPKVMGVLEGFVKDFRFHRGGHDLLAARGIAPASAPEAAGDDEAPSFRVVDRGAKPVRRGAEFMLKGGAATVPLNGAEAEAAGWLLSRADVTERELAAAHPAVAAKALLQRLTEAGILVAM
ncbi:MAG: cupin domain-containing protein [Pseudomonadota bacterium]